MNGNSLSGRARAKLLRHQQQVTAQVAALRASDRMLAGTLAACDAATQSDALAAHLECVQELQVSLHRLDAFLTSRIEQLCSIADDALPGTASATAE
jgi:uracil phosphoribosyltransferase